jgi:hypothetical protein
LLSFGDSVKNIVVAWWTPNRDQAIENRASNSIGDIFGGMGYPDNVED